MDDLYDARIPAGLGGRFYGVYPAVVTDNQDPDGQGRVRVRLPWAADNGDQQYAAWARLATLMAGDRRGTFLIPDPDDEVLVAFAGGDPRQPFVVGALWNGKDAPPAAIDRDNTKKVICSRRGVKITLDDTQGHEAVVIETPGGQKISLTDGPGEIEVADSNGNTIRLESAGITVQSSGTVKVTASQVQVSASIVQVDAAMSRFAGTIQCDALIANSVVGASYTPGAGNLW